MEKKGFTLIELLAVIVILAIIALIATPIILNIIEDSRREAAKDSAYGYIKSIENYIMLSEFDNKNYNKKLIKSESCDKDCDKLTTGFIGSINKTVKGTKPTEIEITIENEKLNKVELKINGYLCNYENNILECGNKKIEEPKLEIINDKALMFNFDYNDKESTIKHNNTLKTDYGLYYNGSNSYSIVGEYNKEKITFETTFVPFSSPTDHQDIVSNTELGGCAIYLKNNKINGYCRIDGSYKEVSSKENINPFNYYHAILTYDEIDLKLYINGELQSKLTLNKKLKQPESSTKLALGANPYGSKAEDSYFNGFIASARLYDRALTEEEILNNYQVDKNKYFKSTEYKIDNKISQNGLLVYYNLNNNIGLQNLENINFVRNLASNQYNAKPSNAQISNNAINFTGNNSYMTIGNIREANITYEVVFEPKNITNSNQHIISSTESGGCGIRMLKNKLSTLCNINGSYQEIASKEIELNKKYYTALTYNGTTLKLYLNGELQSKKDISGKISPPKSGVNLMLSYDPLDGNCFNGSIYSTRVYNRGLEENEIKNNYEFDSKEFSIK